MIKLKPENYNFHGLEFSNSIQWSHAPFSLC